MKKINMILLLITLIPQTLIASSNLVSLKPYQKNFIISEVGKERQLSFKLSNNGNEDLNGLKFNKVLNSKEINFSHKKCSVLKANSHCIIKVKFLSKTQGNHFESLVIRNEKFKTYLNIVANATEKKQERSIASKDKKSYKNYGSNSGFEDYSNDKEEYQEKDFSVDFEQDLLDDEEFVSVKNDIQEEIVVSEKDNNSIINNFTGGFVLPRKNDEIVSPVPTITNNSNPRKVINLNPEAKKIDFILDEDTPVLLNLELYDPENEAMSLEISQEPENGTILINSDNTLMYSPRTNFFGEDYLYIEISDNSGNKTIKKINLTVNSVNDAPSAPEVLTYTVKKNENINFTLIASDVENDELVYSLISRDGNGELNQIDPANYIYNSKLFYGKENINFTVSDGTELTSFIVEIVVENQDLSPIGKNEIHSLENTKNFSFVLYGEDPDTEKSNLSYEIITSPTLGFLSNNSLGQYTYTANNNNTTGTDSLTYRVYDGSSYSETHTVQFVLSQGNRSPLVDENTSFTLLEDNSISFTLNDSDPDNNSLNYNLLNTVNNGVLSGSYPNLIYIPNNNFNGTDSFSYSVSDGEFTVSNTINFTVTPVNDEPIIEDIIITMNEEETKTHTITYSDVENDNIQFYLNNPENYPISINGNTITVIAPEDFYGTYLLSYTANDGLASVDKSLRVNIVNVNDDPTLTVNEYTTNEDTILNAQLSATDKDSDTILYSLKSSTISGSVSLEENGSFEYLPNQDFNGQDFFTVVMNDGTSSIEETITINVIAVNDAPISEDINITMNEDTTYSHSINSSDKENSELTYQLINPENYPVSIVNGQLIVSPPSDFNGTYNLSYTTSDGSLTTNNQININVNSVNDDPELSDNTYTTNEDTPLLNQTLNISDKDGDSLTVSLINSSSNGLVSLNGSQFNYTPNKDYTGTDSFLIKIEDGTSSIEETITINILPINDAPVIEDIVINMNEDTIKNFLISASDTDGDSVVLSLNNDNSYPVSLNGNTLEIRPPSNFNGTYNLSYNANDGSESVTKNITINIIPVNDTPVIDQKEYITNEDTPLNETLSVSDVDSSNHTYTLTNSVSNGTINLSNNGDFLYTPNKDFNGEDSFGVSISDGENTINETVTINVTEINDAPEKISDMIKDVYVDQIYNWSIIDHFTDVDSSNFSYTVDRNPNQGFMEISNNGIINFQAPSLIPNAYNETLVISVSDGEFIETINLTLNYQKENIAPVGEDKDLTIYINQDYSFNLSGIDANGDNLNYSLENSSPIVSSLNNASGDIILNSTEVGNFSFRYKTSDGDLESDYNTINVTVVYEDGTGLLASYYKGTNFQEKHSQRVDSQVNFNWNTSTEPVSGLGLDYYSVKWEGSIYFDEIGDYTFQLSGDDGIKLYIEENLIIEEWNAQPYKTFNQSFTVSEIGKKKITIMYFEKTGQSRVNLSWKKPSESSFKTVEEKYLFPKAIESSDHMFEITINKDLIQDNLYGFPVLFKLELLDNSSFWTHVQSNGHDIRIYDKDQKALPFELLNFDTIDRTGSIWFKTDLTSGVDNKFFIGVNDKDKDDKEEVSLTDDLYRNNVWSAYHLVLHYNENNLLLNSANDENVLLYGNESNTENSLLDDSIYFDSASYIEFSATFSNLDISLESWIKADYLNSDNLSIFGKENSYGVMGISTNQNTVNFFRQSSSGGIETSTIDTMSLNEMEWNFFATGIEANNISAKINMDTLNEAPSMEILNSGAGTYSIAKSVFSNQINFQGNMDETRISKNKLSDEWLETQYKMMTQLNTWWKKDQMMSSENFSNMSPSSLDSSWSTYQSSNYYELRSDPEGMSFLSRNQSYGPGMTKDIDISSNVFKIEFDLVGNSGNDESIFAFFIKLGNNLSANQQNAAITTLWGTQSFGLETRNGFGYMKEDGSVKQIGNIVQESKKITIIVNKISGKYNLYLNDNMILDIDFDKNIEINKLMFNSSRMDTNNGISVKINNLTISEL